MLIKLAVLIASLALAQEATAPWEKDFADARLTWKSIPAQAWRALPRGAAPGALRVLEDAQAGRWSVAGDDLALGGKWLRVDDARNAAKLITLSVAPDGADVVATCGLWLPPVQKRDSANFSFEDRAGPEPPVAPVAVKTRYYRVRAAELASARRGDSLPEVAWLAVGLDERRPEPFEDAYVRLDPTSGLTGRAAAMALAALSKENFVSLDSPLRDPHLWDVAADWVDERLKKLPPQGQRHLVITREASRIVFQLVERVGRGRYVSLASIALPNLQERL